MESWKYLKNTNLELRIYWHCEDDSCSQLSVFLQRSASSSKMLSKFKQTKARSHEESRRLICAACGCKDFRAHPVTEAIQSLIKVEVCSHYDRADENVPSGICSSCRTNLFIAKKDTPPFRALTAVITPPFSPHSTHYSIHTRILFLN